MSQIKGKDTTPEILVRKYLFSKGFRYRKNVSTMPGKPDIVLPKYHTCIFVNGCFWHRHAGCKYAAIPKTRQSFWEDKFKKTVANDRENVKQLKNAGWKVLIVWECELKKDYYGTMCHLIDSIIED